MGTDYSVSFIVFIGVVLLFLNISKFYGFNTFKYASTCIKETDDQWNVSDNNVNIDKKDAARGEEALEADNPDDTESLPNTIDIEDSNDSNDDDWRRSWAYRAVEGIHFDDFEASDNETKCVACCENKACKFIVEVGVEQNGLIDFQQGFRCFVCREPLNRILKVDF